MVHHLQCPHCSCALRVAEVITAPMVTCPRCLAVIPNPGAAADAAAAAVATPVEAETKRDLRGLGCGLVLLPVLFTIGTAAYGHFFRRSGYILPDVKGPVPFELLLAALAILTLGSVCTALFRATRRSRKFLILLEVLGVLALLVNGFICLVALTEGDPEPMIVLLTALAVLTFEAVGIVSWKRWDGRQVPEQPVQRGLSILYTALALIGALVVAGLAFAVLFFFVC